MESNPVVRRRQPDTRSLYEVSGWNTRGTRNAAVGYQDTAGDVPALCAPGTPELRDPWTLVLVAAECINRLQCVGPALGPRSPAARGDVHRLGVLLFGGTDRLVLSCCGDSFRGVVRGECLALLEELQYSAPPFATRETEHGVDVGSSRSLGNRGDEHTGGSGSSRLLADEFDTDCA